MKNLGESIARVLILTAVTLFLLSPGKCQNQISISAVGNQNPVTYVYIDQILPTMGSSQKSSFGGGIEYDRWLTPSLAVGAMYEQNPSDGKLLEGTGREWSIWPQMRREILGVATREFTGRKVSPYVQAGAGALLTDEDGGNAGAGWSHSFAIVAAGGTDYWISPKMAFRAGSTVLATKTGCYNDPTCRPTWGLSHDVWIGLIRRW